MGNGIIFSYSREIPDLQYFHSIIYPALHSSQLAFILLFTNLGLGYRILEVLS